MTTALHRTSINTTRKEITYNDNSKELEFEFHADVWTDDWDNYSQVKVTINFDDDLKESVRDEILAALTSIVEKATEVVTNQ